MRRHALTLLLALAGALGAAAPAGAQERGPCIPGDSGGPTCTLWVGKTTFVADGDTIDVDIAGDGRRKPIRVRMIGLQAMELHRYSRNPERRRGDCHALEATERLEKLLPRHRWVRLAAMNSSSRSGQRYRRAVYVSMNRRWHDVARTMLTEGHALWLPNGEEWAWNAANNRYARLASLAGRGMWNPSRCGAGPQEGAPLRLWVNWDADGEDSENLNGEWVRIKNLDGSAPVSLDGWWLRDSFLRRYEFRGVTVPPGGTVTLHVGSGSDTASDVYWGQAKPTFENYDADGRFAGDGAYLFDPHGDLRAAMTYPCRHACTNPHQGQIDVFARASGDEHVTLRNDSGAPVDLEGYRLETWPYGYAFGGNSLLGPGETMRIDVGGSPDQDTRLFKSWGMRDRILNDAGDVVRLETFDDVTLGCFAWGSGRC